MSPEERVVLDNIVRFYESSGMSRKMFAEKYSRLAGRQDIVTDNFVTQILTGRSLGKKTVAIVAQVLGRKEWELHVPREAEDIVIPAPRTKAIPVYRAITGPPQEYTDGGYPVGHSDRQEFADTTDPNAFYLVPEGDSMIGDDIQEGDLLLVEPNKEPHSGDIVFCRHKGEVTVKRYFQSEAHIELRPSNPAYPSIFIQDDERKCVIFPITRIVRDLRRLKKRLMKK